MPRLPTLALVALCAGAAGFGLYRAFVTPEISKSAELASTESPAKQKPKSPIPNEIPDYALLDSAGSRRSFRSFDQAVVIYNFWATWCAPCRREIPLLNRLRRERQYQGLEVVGVAVDFRADVMKYLQTTTVEYPLLIGEQDGLDALDAFGIPSAFPVSVFADQDKRIVAVKLGELHGDEAAFILDRIVELNAKSIDLAAAKQQISSKLRHLAQERAKSGPAPFDTASQQLDQG
jgi:thiol-disulfide isomerase/thioredoxin